MNEDGKCHCMNCAFGWCCSHPDVKEGWQLFAMSWGHDCEFYKQNRRMINMIKKNKMNEMLGKYCIVRGDRSGVFAGVLESQEGQQVVLSGCRRLWYWSGAASISQLATEGVKNPDNCKFTVTLDRIMLLDAIEVIPATEKAEACIKAVDEWKM